MAYSVSEWWYTPSTATSVAVLLLLALSVLTTAPLGMVKPALAQSQDSLPTVSETVIPGVGAPVPGNVQVRPFPDGMAYDPDNGYLYVSNIGGNGSISVFDTASRSLVKTVVLDNSAGVSTYVSSVKELFFLTGQSLGILDTTTNREVKEINLFQTPEALCYDSTDGSVYVSLSNDSVSVVSASSLTIVSNVPVGPEPLGVYCDSQADDVLVASYGGSSISVINASTHSLVRSVATFAYPASIISAPGVPYIYVLHGNPSSPNPYGAGELAVLRTSDLSDVANLSVGPVGGSSLDDLAYNPLNHDVYVSQYSPFNDGSVEVINTSSNQIVASVVVGAYASGITASQDGRLFVCDQGGYGDTTLIMVIDGASNTISGQMVEPSPFSLAIDGSNGLTFVATSGAPGIQQLIVLNRSYSAWIDTVPLSLNNIFPHQSSYGSFDPATGYVYVADYGGGEVSVFNGADGHLVGTIPVGVWDYGVMFVPTNGELYVTVSDQNEVLIVNTATNSVLGYVQVGGNPTGMAYDSLNGRLYVADDSSSPGPGGSVSVVDTNDNSEIATIPFPSNGYTVSILNVLLGTDGFLYALGWQYGNGVNSGILYKVNTTSDSIVAAIPAAVPDSNSGQMAEDPSGRIYIASGNFIQVFDTQRGSFVGDITAGLETTDVAYDPFTGDLLATNLVSGTVSIIPTGTTPLNVQSVTIKESGLASGATWGVGNSSVRQSTDGSLISFVLRPGSYVFSLLVPEGFSPQSVDFVVGCSAVNLNVALSPTADGETTSASESTVTIISRSTPTCTSPSTTQQPTAVGPSSGGHWLSAWVWQVALVIAVLTVLTISTLSYSFHRKSVQNSTFSRTGNTAT